MAQKSELTMRDFFGDGTTIVDPNVLRDLAETLVDDQDRILFDINSTQKEITVARILASTPISPRKN